MRRQGVPNPTFESVKNTIAPKLRQRLRNSETPSNGVCPEGLANQGIIVPQPRQRLRNNETPSNGVCPEGSQCDAKYTPTFESVKNTI